MVLYHSCTGPQQVAYLLSLVESRCDDMVYATPYPQQDYGRFVVKFEAPVSDNETYDQGGISPCGNVAIPARNIEIRTMEVIY